MKKWTWKQWTAFAIVIAVIITVLVLHLVQPVITFAWAELFVSCSFVVGAVAGYLFKKNEK